MAAIPFLINDAVGGLAHCHGLIRDEGDTLVIESQTQDGIIGLVKGDIRETRISVKEIAGIEVKKSWLGWSDTLSIQMATMKQVAQIPGMKQGRIELPISRSDLGAAEELVASVSAYLHKG